MSDGSIYELYKPFRNSLRELNAEEALHVLWNVAELHASGRKIDHDISVPDEIRRGSRLGYGMCSPWEIELLAKEVILNSHQPFYGPKTKWLGDGRSLARCVNKLKYLSNEISARRPAAQDFWLHLNRMAHQQFRWHSYGPSKMLFARYFRIYRHPLLLPLLEAAVGLDIGQYYVIALALWSQFREHTYLRWPPAIEGLPEITTEALERFVERYAMPWRGMRQAIEEEQNYTDRYEFAYNPLRGRPLVRMDLRTGGHLACPMSNLLAWRMTTGVYYDIVSNAGDFKEGYGAAFQAYVGTALSETLGTSEWRVLPEELFFRKKQEQRTVDWIAAKGPEALFIECKTKRLSQSAKERVDSAEHLHRDLDELAKAVAQTYKGIAAYKDGLYPQIAFDPRCRVVPIVVTLEDWFFMGELAAYTRGQVTEGLAAIGLGGEEATMPYVVCSTQEFEMLACVLAGRTSADVLTPYLTDPRYAGWSLDGYLHDRFHADAVGAGGVFAREFDAMLPERLKRIP